MALNELMKSELLFSRTEYDLETSLFSIIGVGGLFLLLSIGIPGNGNAKTVSSLCKSQYKSQTSTDWKCKRISKGETLETYFPARRKGYEHSTVRSESDWNNKPYPVAIAGITSIARFRHRYERSRDMCLHRLYERLLRR